MTFPVSLVGIDTVGGTIVGPGKPNWTWNGAPISVLGDRIQPHGSGAHIAAVVREGSPWFTIDGIPVTRATSTGTCDHIATGSSVQTVP